MRTKTEKCSEIFFHIFFQNDFLFQVRLCGISFLLYRACVKQLWSQYKDIQISSNEYTRDKETQREKQYAHVYVYTCSSKPPINRFILIYTFFLFKHFHRHVYDITRIGHCLVHIFVFLSPSVVLFAQSVHRPLLLSQVIMLTMFLISHIQLIIFINVLKKRINPKQDKSDLIKEENKSRSR